MLPAEIVLERGYEGVIGRFSDDLSESVVEVGRDGFQGGLPIAGIQCCIFLIAFDSNSFLFGDHVDE